MPQSKPLPTQGGKAAECPKCHEVFTTVTNFDKHLKRIKWSKDGYKHICQNPAELKMQLNNSGWWTIPNTKNEWWSQ